MEITLSSQPSLELQHERYQSIYGKDSDVWLYPRTAGLHTVILDLLAPQLSGKRVLDVGCGAGRLSLYCARLASEVVGVDFSDQAIDLARAGADICSLTNVQFKVGEASELAGRFDVIMLVGVAEHLTDPVRTLEKLLPSLAPGASLLIACPGFSNLRGWSYRTLGDLFGWPMSLADLRQVTLPMLESWAKELGLRCRRVIGALYESVWGPWAAKDMMKRIPPAARDGKYPGGLDLERYRRWLETEIRLGADLLALWERQGLLRRAGSPPVLKNAALETLGGEAGRKLNAYLRLDEAGDTSWCDVAPVSELGGEGIYLLERVGT